MLVLGRKANQSVMIGHEIVISVLAVDGDQVKIGIQAPSHITILRQELYEAVKQENLRAAKLSAQANSNLLPALQPLFQNPYDSK